MENIETIPAEDIMIETAGGIPDMMGILILIAILLIAIYVVLGIFLNKYNKLVNGKGTAMAWIPIANLYLLGKLTVNKVVGWVLVILTLITGTSTTTINGVETEHSLLPAGVSRIITIIVNIAVVGLFIYGVIKYNKLKKEKENNLGAGMQQPMNQNPNMGAQQPMNQNPEMATQPRPTTQMPGAQQPMNQNPGMATQPRPTTQMPGTQQPMNQNNQNNN